MNATVQKWGNSLALRIPSSVAKEIALSPGSSVELTVEDGALTVKPSKKRKMSLSQLLKAVTKENRHSEMSWGAPVGKELL